MPFYLFVIALIAAAWLRGQAPERAALLLFGSAALLSEVVFHFSFYALAAMNGAASRHMPAVGALFVIDATVLAALIMIAVQWNRKWPLAAAAFQTISTLAHLGRLVDPSFDDVAYAVMESFSAFPALLLLALALYRHPRRRTAI